jgi:hypothetical protein
MDLGLWLIIAFVVYWVGLFALTFLRLLFDAVSYTAQKHRGDPVGLIKALGKGAGEMTMGGLQILGMILFMLLVTFIFFGTPFH